MSGAARQHALKSQFGPEDDTQDVDLDLTPGYCIVLFVGVAGRHDARVVDQDVDRSRPSDGCGDRGGVGDVDAAIALWDADVVPDFREPDGIRLGLSPLSTSYGEVAEALLRIEAALTR